MKKASERVSPKIRKERLLITSTRTKRNRLPPLTKLEVLGTVARGLRREGLYPKEKERRKLIYASTGEKIKPTSMA